MIVCACVCMRLHIDTSEFNCPRACQGVVHSADIQVWRFDTKHRSQTFSLVDWLIAKDTSTMPP